MPKVSIFGSLTNIQMLIHTLFKGKKVGVDALGNVYYRGKPRGGTKHERRWVIYKNRLEASDVPAEWHGWLHRQTDVVPDGNSKFRQPWQKPHQSNLTGTRHAHAPAGLHGKRAAASGDYTAWVPPQ